MVGHLYVALQEPAEFGTWEIGYIFNPDYGKQGYATEAARRLLDWLFMEKAAHRVMAMCSPENPSSWRLLERLGMRREGFFRQKAFFRRDAQGRPTRFLTVHLVLITVSMLPLHEKTFISTGSSLKLLNIFSSLQPAFDRVLYLSVCLIAVFMNESTLSATRLA